MIRITKKPSSRDKALISAKDILAIIESNRARIRTLSTTVLTVCGLLLSTSFAILIFVLTNANFHVHWSVPALLIASSVSLTISIAASVLSVLVPTPVGASTKLELIDVLVRIYHREQRRAVLSTVFLLVAATLFTIAIVVFGTTVIP